MDPVEEAQEIVRQRDWQFHVGNGEVDLLRMAESLSSEEWTRYTSASRLVRALRRAQ